MLVMERVACARRDDDKARLSRWCVAVWQAILTTLQTWAKYVNFYAYADIALSSTPFCTSAPVAASLLAGNAAVAGTLGCICGILLYSGVVTLAAASGFIVYLITASPPQFSGLLGKQFVALNDELSALGNPILFAGIAAIVGVVVGGAMMHTVTSTAQTLLYCLLWDSSDGVLNADCVPTSFLKFAKKQGIKVKQE